MLPELIEQMAHIPGVEWIRLHYAYPAHFPEDLFRVMRVIMYVSTWTLPCSISAITCCKRCVAM